MCTDGFGAAEWFFKGVFAGWQQGVRLIVARRYIYTLYTLGKVYIGFGAILGVYIGLGCIQGSEEVYIG